MNGLEPSLGELVELVTVEVPHHAASGILASNESDGFVLRVQSAALGSGVRVRAQRGVPDDARYTVAGVIVQPGPPLLRVQTTGMWQRVQQREFVRLRLSAQVWARLAAPAETARDNSMSPAGLSEMSGQVIDVSAGGVQLETTQALTAGDRILLRFELPNAGVVEVEGNVVRSHPGRREGFLSGVQFMSLPAHQESMIVRFIYEQQVRTRRHSLV